MSADVVHGRQSLGGARAPEGVPPILAPVGQRLDIGQGGSDQIRRIAGGEVDIVTDQGGEMFVRGRLRLIR
jgi:hypothetical protein